MVEGTWLYVLFFSIYTFHMPCFVFISGYFSKKKNGTQLINLVITYVIFQFLFTIFAYCIGRTEIFNPNLASPFYTLWYLMALILWKLITPYFVKLKQPLLVSFLLAICVGFDRSFEFVFTLSRLAVLYPFFLAGYCAQGKQVARIQNVNKIVSISMFVLLIGVLYIASPMIESNFFFHGRSYYKVDKPLWYAAIYRCVVLALGAMVSICFLSLVPQKKVWFSDMGTRTMVPYILHGFFTWGISKSWLQGVVYTYPEKIIFLLLYIVLIFILSSKPVSKLLRPLIRPDAIRLWLKKVFVKPEGSHAG